MRMMRFPSRTGQVAPGANEHSAVGAKPLGGATQDWPDAAYRKAEGSVPSGAPPTRLPRFDILPRMVRSPVEGSRHLCEGSW